MIMNKKIKKMLRKSERLRLFWEKFSLLKAKSGLVVGDESFTKKSFHKRVGRVLDLGNPKTFSDKLNFLKLNYRDSLITQCTDKYLVREYVKSLGYGDILNELYGVYDSFGAIDFEELPEKFFLKCNHTSGANYLYNAAAKIDLPFLEKKFNFYMRKNFYYLQREWNYKDIKPLIIAEKILKDSDNNFPVDYKIFCFNGQPHLVMYCEGLCDDKGERGEAFSNFYDMDFQLLDLKINNENIPSHSIVMPQNFFRMKEIAAALSKPFPFCRVDLYNINGRIIFGELTFFHAAGLNIIEPLEWEFKMGDWLDLEQRNLYNGTWT